MIWLNSGLVWGVGKASSRPGPGERWFGAAARGGASLAPGKRAVAGRVQAPFRVAREAERLEQRALPAQQFLGDQLADAPFP